MATAKKSVALDTNFVLDLGGRDPSAEPLLNALQKAEYSTVITPTVIGELAHFASDPEEECHEDAKNAFGRLHELGITPQAVPPLQNGFAEGFSDYIRAQGLLPSSERNDGKVLGEASLVGATFVISVGDLVKVDRFLLKAAFEDKGLDPVDVVDKVTLLKAFHVRY